MCIKKNKEFLEFEMYDDPTAAYKKFSFKELMKFLSSDRGIESVMVEGGAKTYYHALKDGIIDKIILFIAPKILGGTGIPFFKGGNGLSINEALSLKDFSTENIGVDILIEGYL
jgi:diaminohydroxyphosphoribosylaminopyrimidine deaminase/5-amino-6-(5-phosphoribosylamino)uracil reductase